MSCCYRGFIFRAKWRVFYLSSLQCSEADRRNLQSKQQNHSHLKANHNSTLLKGEIYLLKCKPNRQVNEKGTPMYWCHETYISISPPLHYPQVWTLHVHDAPSHPPNPSQREKAQEGVWPTETCPEIWTVNACRKLSTDRFEALQLKLGSLLWSFTYNYEGASGEVFSSTNCSETFWEKSLRSVVLNLSLIFPQWTSVLKDFCLSNCTLKIICSICVTADPDFIQRSVIFRGFIIWNIKQLWC